MPKDTDCIKLEESSSKSSRTPDSASSSTPAATKWSPASRERCARTTSASWRVIRSQSKSRPTTSQRAEYPIARSEDAMRARNPGLPPDNHAPSCKKRHAAHPPPTPPAPRDGGSAMACRSPSCVYIKQLSARPRPGGACFRPPLDLYGSGCAHTERHLR